MIMQLVASRRGVAALPNWVVADYLAYHYVTARPLGADGMWGTLYGAMRADQTDSAYMQDFMNIARDISFRTLKDIRKAD
jgi:LysR family transcriptional regulator for metE and metH